MANNSYMSISGINSGLISAGCSTPESMGKKCQATHVDEIMVLSVDHGLLAGNNSCDLGSNARHLPVVITKYVDKSSPLLAKALDDGENIKCTIHLYRTSVTASEEKYYKIELREARITQIALSVPPASSRGDSQPIETVAIRYGDIILEHITASTSAGMTWQAEK
ncbi:type VI secretion system protein [Pseudomonas endophytica]|uniref:Type VI secretion system protein n=1 Tax=Pseudomonas endophytica TaxID=1563157 RepID=A0A0Q0WXX8_9PSED|nr:Hcp family type VI secretion system effector [Pseudomonas endophytica]KQB52329.1 type VI secretion system protein [Pseudomonas endophytica]